VGQRAFARTDLDDPAGLRTRDRGCNPGDHGLALQKMLAEFLPQLTLDFHLAAANGDP